MENIIKVHDKQFSLFIENEKISAAVANVADQINNDLKKKDPVFLVILNGAFMFAADLFKMLSIDCELSFVKLASYSGTQSTERVKKLIGLGENLKGRNVVIVEDIIDTGITMENLLEQLHSMQAKEVKVATLLFKPNAFVKDFDIDYIGMNIPNDFIVGYGLDYNGHGRNFKDIYKIVE
jgi:hypoxanthine phosphoribosyltransferase